MHNEQDRCDLSISFDPHWTIKKLSPVPDSRERDGKHLEIC